MILGFSHYFYSFLDAWSRLSHEKRSIRHGLNTHPWCWQFVDYTDAANIWAHTQVHISQVNSLSKWAPACVETASDKTKSKTTIREEKYTQVWRENSLLCHSHRHLQTTIEQKKKYSFLEQIHRRRWNEQRILSCFVATEKFDCNESRTFSRTVSHWLRQKRTIETVLYSLTCLDSFAIHNFSFTFHIKFLIRFFFSRSDRQRDNSIFFGKFLSSEFFVYRQCFSHCHSSRSEWTLLKMENRAHFAILLHWLWTDGKFPDSLFSLWIYNENNVNENRKGKTLFTDNIFALSKVSHRTENK